MNTPRLGRFVPVIVLVVLLLAAASAAVPAGAAPVVPAGLSFIPAVDGARALAAVHQVQLTASDGAAGDHFGQSVAIFGATAVVGSPADDVGTNGSQGSAFVFVRSGSTWTQQARLTASDGAAGDQFGRAVSISGDTIAVSAAYDDVGGNQDQGSVYVFVRDGANWTQQAKVTAADGKALEWFGTTGIAVDGDTLVVGSPYDDTAPGSFDDAGSAYVFVRTGVSWSQQTRLTVADTGDANHFGFSVAVAGDTVLVSVFTDYYDLSSKGSAYVFVRNGTTWTRQATLIASDGAAGDHFGTSVALSGETAVVGAQDDTVGGKQRRGSAYVFVRSGTTWTRQAKLIASDGATGDEFGRSVAVSGDTVVVGASEDDVGRKSNQGSIYVFKRSGHSWSQQDKTTAAAGSAGDSIGYKVALSGATGVAGALYDDVAGQVDQGSALVFVLLEKPGRPRAESPVRRTSTRRPTFEWTRTTRASSFELRVYKGSRLILKKAGISARATSWRPASRLPRGIALTWKVRARNPAGYGGWSNAPRFSVR